MSVDQTYEEYLHMYVAIFPKYVNGVLVRPISEEEWEKIHRPLLENASE